MNLPDLIYIAPIAIVVLSLLGLLVRFGGAYYSRRAALSSEAARKATKSRHEQERSDLQVKKAYVLADAETVFGISSYPPPFYLDIHFANAGGSPVTVDQLTGILEGERGKVNLPSYAPLRISAQTKRRDPVRITAKDLPSGVEPYHVEKIMAVDLTGHQVVVCVEGRDEAHAISEANPLDYGDIGDPDSDSYLKAELFEEKDPDGGCRFVVFWREQSHSRKLSYFRRSSSRREAENLFEDILEEAQSRLAAGDNVISIERSLGLIP